jgi:hypothetical protein
MRSSGGGEREEEREERKKRELIEKRWRDESARGTTKRRKGAFKSPNSHAATS